VECGFECKEQTIVKVHMIVIMNMYVSPLSYVLLLQEPEIAKSIFQQNTKSHLYVN